MMQNNQQASISLPADHCLERERRSAKRHVALLRVALLHASGSKDLCVVRNVSATGLSARAYRKFSIGEQVQIEFRSGELLSGAVVWERDWEIGIAFPQAIDVTAVLASRWITEMGRRRNLPRIEINCPGRLKTGLGSREVMLQDISQGGARVEVKGAAVDGSHVVLTLPDLPPLAGVARWAGGTEVGISFNECISFERLARWIQALRNQ
jgi:hypothetical protein